MRGRSTAAQCAHLSRLIRFPVITEYRACRAHGCQRGARGGRKGRRRHLLAAAVAAAVARVLQELRHGGSV
eukprot:COSAG04_NODE_991_length_8915_cov_4.477654_8_plen_71_part_00